MGFAGEELVRPGSGELLQGENVGSVPFRWRAEARR
jgi:hypothetical protein